MESTLESGLDATRLAGRLTGNQPWAEENCSYPLDNGLQAAKAAGLTIVTPEPNQLLIDIDEESASIQYNQMIGMFCSFFDVVDIKDNPSKSGAKHRHITLTLGHPISNVERVLLQAILGSDPKRELLSYVRLLRGIEPATLFFEQPAPGQGPPPKEEITKANTEHNWGSDF
jgi:hypothetical protein